ncbi:MAG: GNAT family N-acetyltransferase [Desulfomonile sp.]|nr:GNAT family N-acetyltransferase [Desulfomonile sp.]
MRRGLNSGCGKRMDLSSDLYDFPGPFEAVPAPYPYYYESKAFTRNGKLITIRPIKRDDAGRLLDFFDTLSRETIFFRFLTNLRSLPLDWVRRFTEIDYRQDVAMVALERADDDERIVGVCRVMRCADSDSGEIAVVVGDPWHDQGIGTTLLRRTLQICRELGFTKLWGLVSSRNEKVARMSEKLGFVKKTETHEDLFEVEIDLDEMP